MGSMKTVLLGQMATNLLALCLMAMVAVPLSFFLAALWVDKHRLSLTRRGPCISQTKRNVDGSDTVQDAA
jgi:hypothetical protein